MSSKRRRNQAEAQLRRYLRESPFLPGDRLPGERDLAAAVGIGRTALRPALATLVAEGSLERRPQSGTYLSRRPLPAVGSGTVAIIAPLQVRGVQGAWAHQVVSAIERTLNPLGLRPLLLDQSDLADDPCSVKTLAKRAAAEQARAAILIHPLGTRDKIACALGLLHNAGVHPVVVSSRTYAGLASHVYFDSEWGGYLATRHLVQRGHRAIGFAGAASGHQWVQERLWGYHQALATADIPRQRRWESLGEPGERAASVEDGLRAARKLLVQEELTAVFAANDAVALGFWQACREAGRRIPEDLSLVGFDNDPESLIAGLTTIERPSATVGEAAARVTLERISAGLGADAVSVRLRPVLIERRSVLSHQEDVGSST